MSFDPRAYWTRTVPGIEAMMPFSPLTPEHDAQERALEHVLFDLHFGSVLEVGCGLGRITMMLADLTDDLTAIDIGSDQVAVTSRRVPSATVVQCSIQDWEPDRKWDLVIATEVLMHIPPEDIQAVCDKLRRLSSRWVVTVDWTKPITGPIAEWNWRHPYRALFGNVWAEIPVGLQSIFVVRP